MPAEITRVAEDYLTLIWKANEWPGDDRRPITSELAAALGVTPPTVSANLKRLAREQLIDYEPYGTIALTDTGEEVAIEVVRRHRIIETFLVEQLGVPWDRVHHEADRLEHAVSDYLIERMDAALGFPEVDPHGDPIPRGVQRTASPAPLLSQFSAGESVRIIRVSDANPEILRFLTARGIALHAVLHIVAPMSSMGLMSVKHDDDLIEMSNPIALAIRAVPLETE